MKFGKTGGSVIKIKLVTFSQGNSIYKGTVMPSPLPTFAYEPLVSTLMTLCLCSRRDKQTDVAKDSSVIMLV